MFKRECIRCSKMFRPTGKACKLCNKCHATRLKHSRLKKNVMQKPKV